MEMIRTAPLRHIQTTVKYLPSMSDVDFHRSSSSRGDG